MAQLKVLDCDFKPQTIQVTLGVLPLKTLDGEDWLYKIDKCFASVNELSRHKKKVIFEAELKDGKTLKAETSEKIFERIKHNAIKNADVKSGYVQKTASLMPKSKDESKGSSSGGESSIGMGIYWMFLIGGLLYLIFIWPDTHNGRSGRVNHAHQAEVTQKQKEQQIKDNRRMATVLCQEGVRNRLKAPRSAKFRWGDLATYNGMDLYILISHVDAENSFGANIRTYFRCKMRYKETAPEGQRWELVELSMR